MRTHIILATVVAFVIAACAGGGPSDDDTEPPVATVTETETVTATPTSDVGATGEFETIEQDLILAPQEPVEVQAGERYEFSVLGEDFPPALDVALLPCENVSFEAAGMSLLVRDGVAVDLGETDTGSAAIVSVNGEEVEPATFVGEVSMANEPGSADPAVAFEVSGDQPDCAVPLVFDDADGDDEFDAGDERASGAKVTIVT